MNQASEEKIIDLLEGVEIEQSPENDPSHGMTISEKFKESSIDAINKLCFMLTLPDVYLNNGKARWEQVWEHVNNLSCLLSAEMSSDEMIEFQNSKK